MSGRHSVGRRRVSRRNLEWRPRRPSRLRDGYERAEDVVVGLLAGLFSGFADRVWKPLVDRLGPPLRSGVSRTTGAAASAGGWLTDLVSRLVARDAPQPLTEEPDAATRTSALTRAVSRYRASPSATQRLGTQPGVGQSGIRQRSSADRRSLIGWLASIPSRLGERRRIRQRNDRVRRSLRALSGAAQSASRALWGAACGGAAAVWSRVVAVWRPRTVEARRRRAVVGGAAAVAFLILTVGFPFSTLISQHRQLTASAAQLAAVRQENRQLRIQAKQLSSKTEIERRARQDYQLVEPGQTLYALLPGRGAGGSSAGNPSGGGQTAGDPAHQALVPPSRAPDLAPDPGLATPPASAAHSGTSVRSGGSGGSASAHQGGAGSQRLPSTSFWSRVASTLEFWQ